MGTVKQIPMTAEGYERLKADLGNRLHITRPRLTAQLQEAIGDETNLAENSIYQATMTEQERNEAAIAALEEKLAHAEIIDVSKLSGDIVRFGATVTLLDEDTLEKKVFKIVGEPEADASRGLISASSPMARALIGQTKGSSAEVQVREEVKSYKIKDVRWST
jgi:transcription elongation factor GreA